MLSYILVQVFLIIKIIKSFLKTSTFIANNCTLGFVAEGNFVVRFLAYALKYHYKQRQLHCKLCRTICTPHATKEVCLPRAFSCQTKVLHPCYWNANVEQWWANLKSNPTHKSQIFLKIDLNQLSKSQIPIFPQISNLLYANLKLNLKSLIGMQYLCYIVNLKFTPAILYAVCANTQTVSKACVLFIVTHSVIGSVHNIGIVLHSKKNGFNCLCTQLYVINVAICRDLTSF